MKTENTSTTFTFGQKIDEEVNRIWADNHEKWLDTILENTKTHIASQKTMLSLEFQYESDQSKSKPTIKELIDSLNGLIRDCLDEYTTKILQENKAISLSTKDFFLTDKISAAGWEKSGIKQEIFDQLANIHGCLNEQGNQRVVEKVYQALKKTILGVADTRGWAQTKLASEDYEENQPQSQPQPYCGI